MDLLWMILWVFLVCAEAEKETKVKVELGHNVTLNCSVNNSDTYWYMEINHSQFRGAISRSYSGNPASTQYYVYTSGNKYSAFGNNLMITNITADDCRLYFCGRKINSNVQFVDKFQIVSNVSVEAKSQHLWQNEFMVFSSFGVNILFVSVALVYVVLRLRKRRSCDDRDYENTKHLKTPQISRSRTSRPSSLPAPPPREFGLSPVSKWQKP